MAIVPQTKRRKIELVNDFVQAKIQDANLKLYREDDAENIFDATFKATLDVLSKQDEADIIKALRWLADNLGFAVPVAFTDQEAKDNIHPNIIDFEDGL